MGDAFTQYKMGLNHVGAYAVSGIPFATSSLSAPTGSGAPLKVDFPFVTRFVVIKNTNSTSANLRVGFSANGIKGTNYILLNKDESFSADLKLTSIFLIGDTTAVNASVVAGMTGIPANQYDLASAYSGSVGVG
jgi:hypothetical protein